MPCHATCGEATPNCRMCFHSETPDRHTSHPLRSSLGSRICFLALLQPSRIPQRRQHLNVVFLILYLERSRPPRRMDPDPTTPATVRPSNFTCLAQVWDLAIVVGLASPLPCPRQPRYLSACFPCYPFGPVSASALSFPGSLPSRQNREAASGGTWGEEGLITGRDPGCGQGRSRG